MIIRREQMKAFADYEHRSFFERMTRHLRGRFASQLAARHVSESDLPGWIDDQITSARRYGLVAEDDVRRYLECSALLGPRFDRDAATTWAGDVLRDAQVPSRLKMTIIQQLMLFAEVRA